MLSKRLDKLKQADREKGMADAEVIAARGESKAKSWNVISVW